MTSRDCFDETELPCKDEFYNTLTEECISDEDYKRAQDTWDNFKIQNMQQYHDHYLALDVLLLADVFENFGQSFYVDHKLDCLHYYTLPSLSWSAALKFTKVQVELLTDSEQYLMIESAMRGGISQISHRFAEANNELAGGYNPSLPKGFITYLDANNLYGWAMSQPLPIGDFKFKSQEEVDSFDISKIRENSETGYILECDITYPEHLHDLHNDYPLAPEHLTVTEDMLSPYAKSFEGKLPRPSKKLVPNLLDKIKYVVHSSNLKYYVEQGLVVTKIHRILSFTQRAWLKPYIDHVSARICDSMQPVPLGWISTSS